MPDRARPTSGILRAGGAADPVRQPWLRVALVAGCVVLAAAAGVIWAGGGAPGGHDPIGSSRFRVDIPVDVNELPRGTGEPTEPAGRGWTLVNDASLFGGPGLQLTYDGVVLEDRRIAIGVDEDNGPAGQARPGVWIAANCQTWRRVSANRVDDGGETIGASALVMTGVAVSPSRTLIAVGHASLDSRRSRPAVWRSTDGGERWHLVGDDLPPEGALADVSWIDGEFVAVGRSQHALTVWTSSAGERWEIAELSAGTHPVSMLAAAGRITVVGVVENTGRVWSWDVDAGVDQAVSSDLPEGLLPQSAAVNSDGDSFVLVGEATAATEPARGIVWVSSDATTWTEALRVPDATLRDVAVTEGRLVLVGDLRERGAIWTSESIGEQMVPIPLHLLPYQAEVHWILENSPGVTAFGVAHRETLVWEYVPLEHTVNCDTSRIE